jgi:hypothetical protein
VTQGAALRAIVLVAGLFGVLGGTAHAEHEVYYRYIVLGYVQDGRGAALQRVPVELTRDKTGFSYFGETGPDGFFLIIARLGDESAGERLTLRVGGATTGITARFDPSNHADHRGTRIDLRGGAFQERVASFASTLARFLAGERR